MSTAATLGIRQVCGLIDLLYQGVDDERAWAEFLARSSAALGASSAHFFSNGAIDREGFWLPYGVEASALPRYEAHFRRLDSWHAARPRPASGRWALMCPERVVPDEVFLQSEFYRDFLLPQGQRWGRSCYVSPPSAHVSGYVLSYFRAANRACFGAREDAVIGEIGRHLARIEQLGAQSAQACALEREPGAAVFLLTEFGGLIQCNGEAVELQRKGLATVKSGILRFDAQELNLWFYGALRPRSVPDGGFRPPRFVGRLGGVGAIEAEFGPVALVASSPLLRTARRALSLRPLHPALSTEAIPQASRRFRWTPTESSTAAQLAAGETVAAIAAGRGVSVETVRSHLKTAKRKAGVHRQGDLVRLLLRIASGADVGA